MKTEALWYLGERRIEARSADIPEPEAHEVLVEMEVCGICGWDLLAYAGRFGKFHAYPFRAGHEGIGRIVRAGSLARGLSVGQRVAVHEVPIDERGGGLMARHAVRSWDKVSVMPESPSIPVEKWIVEPAACIVNGLVHSGIQPGDSVALVGAGYMGLLMLQGLARTMAARVAVFEAAPERLELARKIAQRAGAVGCELVDARAGAGERARGFDVVIEASGAAAALDLAFALVKPYGIVENFAWHHHRHEFDLDDWHTKGWRILNVQPQMNPDFDAIFPRTIALMAAGAISNEGLVTHVVPLERAEEAYAAGLDKTGGYVKGVVDFRKK
jgi:2-desacetyl-2-hydroxyethyl bacteriochlorophyllide A dehydrogenase